MTVRPKVLITRRWPPAAEQRLAARYELTVNESDRPMDAAALVRALKTQDAVCPTVSDTLDEAVLEAGAGGAARILGNYGVGVNHIDLQACARLGLVVSNTPDVLTDATAELAILLMLMTARRAGEGERELRSGRWVGWRPTHMTGAQVTGKTLGLVGFGRIGQATARKAHHGLGMRILYNSRRRAEPAVEAETGAQFRPELDDLMAQADFVSLHMPGGAETRHLIDARRLALMKPGAFLINTARGAVVDEAALVAALEGRRIAGAGLDVYEREPELAAGLERLENAVLLPHLGSATLETRTAMGLRVADNLDAFFDGREPPDRVSPRG
jgi:lactate dehydrogenase-like 2-hydroxyacid dehydrogenase